MRQGLSGKAPDGAARLAFAFGWEGGASPAVVGGRWVSPSTVVSSRREPPGLRSYWGFPAGAAVGISPPSVTAWGQQEPGSTDLLAIA